MGTNKKLQGRERSSLWAKHTGSITEWLAMETRRWRSTGNGREKLNADKWSRLFTNKLSFSGFNNVHLKGSAWTCTWYLWDLLSELVYLHWSVHSCMCLCLLELEHLDYPDLHGNAPLIKFFFSCNSKAITFKIGGQKKRKQIRFFWWPRSIWQISSIHLQLLLNDSSVDAQG